MPFDLFITSTEGKTRRALRSPYATRQETGRTVRIVVANEWETRQEVDDFVTRVSTAGLGVSIRHEASGVTFRTEASEESPS
jgi:hypothetical protein